ncbi:hypothetical protein GGS23DRAFT_209593 [Durotheca rogersii]|uniref:uncharacterized protein n=1 Tax=Durotheca rogersii TaxID=419775 RepID=UPI002220E11F|nr:uncharacterized protein GGS23DRAFT_209593 [Durotheca rogersii]KAI5860781.1 hypothetical protein GGS23DRAFT_209593 [Durotheca rogersii]
MPTSEANKRGLKREKWRLRESLGRYGTLVITGGAIVSALVLGFLSLLWVGQGPGSGENASAVWRFIAMRGWFVEAATLCTMVIQVCASAQALICTSLAAATLLETTGVPLSQVAEFSTMRGANDGPWRFVYLTFRSIRNFFSVQSLLMLVLLLGTTATHFSSTILVTDLEVSSITTDPTQMLLNVSLSDDIETGRPSRSQWLLKPTDYAVFGEIPSGINVEPTTGGFSDTGNVRRLFPPLGHENRTKIRHYSGSAYGINSRVACTPPVIGGRFHYTRSNVRGLPFLLSMVGQISYKATFERAGLAEPLLCSDGKCLPTQFNCTLPTAGIPGGQGIYMCLPDISNVIDENVAFLSDGRDRPITPHSMVFLVTRNNGSFDEWSFAKNTSRIPDNPSRVGEWARWRLGNKIVFEASICFSELLWEMSQVDMSTSHDAVEPTIYYDPKAQFADSSAVRALLGANAGPTDAADRSLLRINAVGNTTTDSRLLHYLDGAINSGVFGSQEPRLGTTINGGGTSFGLSTINPFVDYVAVFEDVLVETNRPAVAIQSIMTMMAMSLHYANLALLDVAEEVSITTSAPINVPVRWTGLAVVAGVVTVDTLCVVAITTMFLLRTRYSKQGHFWHAVSQLISERTIGVLQASPEARDEHAVERAQVGDPVMVVARCKRTGRVQVIRKDDIEDGNET